MQNQENSFTWKKLKTRKANKTNNQNHKIAMIAQTAHKDTATMQKCKSSNVLTCKVADGMPMVNHE